MSVTALPSDGVFTQLGAIGGNVVVFLPGAPNPWSGSVVYVSEDRVEPLDMLPQDAIKNIRVLGRGSAKITSAGL